MKIIHKNEGGKIPYTVSGTRLTIDDQVTYNLARYERDEASHIDVCRDKHGQLVSGVIPGTAEQYVAQIDIPGRTYRYVAEGVDEEGNPRQRKEAEARNMERVTLTLWSVEG